MAEEKSFNIPLRKEFQKSPKYKRSKKAVSAIRQFLQKHMKSNDVKIGKGINLKIWERGIKNPPHHIKVTALKDDKGVVTAELFGIKKQQDKTKEKAKPEEKKKADKTETKKEASSKESKK